VVQGDQGIDCVLLFGEGEGERRERERESFGGKRFVSRRKRAQNTGKKSISLFSLLPMKFSTSGGQILLRRYRGGPT
jgi:hypothetical protein